MTMKAKPQRTGRPVRQILRSGAALLPKAGAVCSLAVLLSLVAAVTSYGQGSRKDDIVFGPSGHPIAGATVRVCQATATGTPCTPLATLYTDATLTTTAPNPLQADGIGNYHFYASAGRYMIQITGPGISGTMIYPDVILAPDVSSTSNGNNISAFGLTLGGNLNVAGNASVTGTLTTGSFSPTSLSPSSLTVAGNASVAGPRPYIDVTAPPYNADPTGLTDSTTALQAAFTAACTISVTAAGRPGVFLPPGKYSIAQTQTGVSTTAPVFTICADLHIFSNGSLSTGDQGALPPKGATIQVSAGASPNNAPVFDINGKNSQTAVNVTLENLTINGYNQAVWVQSTSDINLKNDMFSVSVTGQTDNTPLKVTNTLWIWIEHCQMLVNSGTVPTLLLTGETPLGGEGQYVSNLIVSDTQTYGGGFEYVGRSAAPTLANTWVFRNVTQENVNQPFISITETTAGNIPGVLDVLLDSDEQADSSDLGNPLVYLNIQGYLQNLTILSSVTQEPNATAVTVASGTVKNYFNPSGQLVSDTSSNPVGLGLTNDSGPVSIDETSTSAPIACAGYFGGCEASGIEQRWFSAGNRLSTLGLDASTGVVLGDGATHGYSSGVAQTALGDTDIRTANLLPPTGFGGTATTGGSLAAATYYGVIWASEAGAVNNCPTAGINSTLAYAAGVAVSGSNNAVNFSWTAPQPTPGPVNGYCLYVSASNPGFDGTVNSGLYISGGATTSFHYTGQTQTSLGTIYPASPMTSAHRFTYNSLGVNTTTPAYNLDVNGTAAVNSLNGVQKAERFAGSDAGVQINACLTTAAATSGICDARGLTGTYTATHHISIPAHTALLWCQAKLTISDTSTNDAVELGGDGAAMYGCGEAGSGTVPRPQTSGYIACGIAGCIAVDNPNAGSANVDWIHIEKMYLQADGASSTVVNLTSVGHTDIENNRFVLGTGGGSYGVYGNTSTGNQDSTNSLVKHNEFDAQSQNDTCLYLAGVFNSIKVEQNSCYLPASNTGTIGFALAKDSNGNYPDNDEFDANDCEAATTSFGQICFNLIGAQNVQIGPTNRCENVYNCIQFPSDGSAVGNHMIDPYLSPSVNTMVKPNEPATAQQAMDNTGTNWQPSFHYGLSDLGGTNLLSNPGFEGWRTRRRYSPGAERAEPTSTKLAVESTRSNRARLRPRTRQHRARTA